LTKVVGRWSAGPDDVEILTQLIQREPALVTARDVTGETPLHHVIAQIRPGASDADNATFEALADLILRTGADPNAKDNKGFTPLFFASTPRAATLLVERGARVNDADNLGNTALMHAVHDRALFDALLTLGADAHQANLAGASAHTWTLLVRSSKAADPIGSY
jgi:ankyrin repeat protein